MCLQVCNLWWCHRIKPVETSVAARVVVLYYCAKTPTKVWSCVLLHGSHSAHRALRNCSSADHFHGALLGECGKRNQDCQRGEECNEKIFRFTSCGGAWGSYCS